MDSCDHELEKGLVACLLHLFVAGGATRSVGIFFELDCDLVPGTHNILENNHDVYQQHQVKYVPTNEHPPLSAALSVR